MIVLTVPSANNVTFLIEQHPFQLIRRGKDEEANEFNHSHYDFNMKVLILCAAAQTCHFPTSKANPGGAKKKTPKNKERRDTFPLWFSLTLIFHLYLLSSFTKTW